MQNMESIRRYYGVPAKRGLKVKSAGVEGVVTGTPRGSRSYINVRWSDGKRETVHPLSVDYCVDGTWIEGNDLKAKHDAKWDRFNAQLNKRKERP